MLAFRQLKNAYTGYKCALLGNGPSLTLDIIKQLQLSGVYSFVVNGFCLIFDEINYRPNAVCMSNFDAIKRFIKTYPRETIKFLKAGWRQHLDYAVENVYELPFNCEHDLGKHNGPFIKDGYFTLDPAKENFCGDTVLLDFAIPLAFYMGFKEMYLLGVDCDYSKGYFSGKYSVSATKNFKGMVNNDYSIAIPSFRYVNDFLTKHGCRMYKLAENKRLDFIETCSLEHALGKNMP
ncbi:MAG: hypothetical protein V3U02_09005 [Calditrichia bacterium]